MEEIIKIIRKAEDKRHKNHVEAGKNIKKKYKQQTEKEMLDDEIIWLNHQIEMIEVEYKLAEKSRTNIGNQSMIIYRMWICQLNKRLSKLKLRQKE